jgi:hypothetical protein
MKLSMWQHFLNLIIVLCNHRKSVKFLNGEEEYFAVGFPKCAITEWVGVQ